MRQRHCSLLEKFKFFFVRKRPSASVGSGSTPEIDLKVKKSREPRNENANTQSVLMGIQRAAPQDLQHLTPMMSVIA
jgi:hypothetical protein